MPPYGVGFWSWQGVNSAGIHGELSCMIGQSSSNQSHVGWEQLVILPEPASATLLGVIGAV